MELFPSNLTDLARKVIEENRAAGKLIALAESCTGGLVSGVLTEIPGSSDVVGRGFVTYSNDAKRELLGVHEDVLETFGAVSVATAWAMALGALERSHADVAVAVTGIAGPGGGSEQKPVGTVVFARARRGEDPEQVVADTKIFADEGRTAVRLQAVRCALELLLPDAPAPASDGP
jgi:nicotinamide-nucleotide amidase|tara:strand:+ start:47466 stop:47993 length:528 start_codon:yes stop_codon:yes gene_type:complete